MKTWKAVVAKLESSSAFEKGQISDVGFQGPALKKYPAKVVGRAGVESTSGEFRVRQISECWMLVIRVSCLWLLRE